jgi:drug/metabolite transporter (DMT)-like permease
MGFFMIEARYTGYIAAGFTSLFWSVNSLLYASAGRRIGSFTVNQLRLAMASAMLAAAHVAYFGALWPVNATSGQIGYFALSGLVGLAIGDSAYFASLVLTGPKCAAVALLFAPDLYRVLQRA